MKEGEGRDAGVPLDDDSVRDAVRELLASRVATHTEVRCLVRVREERVFQCTRHGAEEQLLGPGTQAGGEEESLQLLVSRGIHAREGVEGLPVT